MQPQENIGVIPRIRFLPATPRLAEYLEIPDPDGRPAVALQQAVHGFIGVKGDGEPMDELDEVQAQVQQQLRAAGAMPVVIGGFQHLQRFNLPQGLRKGFLYDAGKIADDAAGSRAGFFGFCDEELIEGFAFAQQIPGGDGERALERPVGDGAHLGDDLIDGGEFAQGGKGLAGGGEHFAVVAVGDEVEQVGDGMAVADPPQGAGAFAQDLPVACLQLAQEGGDAAGVAAIAQGPADLRDMVARGVVQFLEQGADGLVGSDHPEGFDGLFLHFHHRVVELPPEVRHRQSAFVDPKAASGFCPLMGGGGGGDNLERVEVADGVERIDEKHPRDGFAKRNVVHGGPDAQYQRHGDPPRKKGKGDDDCMQEREGGAVGKDIKRRMGVEIVHKAAAG